MNLFNIDLSLKEFDNLMCEQNKGKQLKVINNKVVAVDYTQSEEDKLTSLRAKRNNECFNIINRGLFWYEKLSEKQKEELQTWYYNWLDVTVTKVIPQKPNWLN